MKKSLVVIALVVAALCSLFVFSVSATEQENIHISSTEFQVRQGDEFTTTIYIADNANIIDFEVLLKYDTDKLTLISATENENIKGVVVINAETAGSIGINYSRTSENVNKQAMLVDLTFRVDEYLSSGVYDCLTVDTSGPYIAHRLVNGLLEEVDFNCEFASLSIYEIGDVDLNNKVDIGDATYIRRHLAKLHTLTDFQLLFANAQNDGLVDIADAVALQRHLAKLEVDNYGDRVNVLFCNTDGEVLIKKSIKIGGSLNKIPDVPLLSGYSNGRWSLSKTEYIAPDYTNLTSELTVYAIYDKSASPYMQYYMAQINDIVNQYNGVITTNWELDTVIYYEENRAYRSEIVWRSSDAGTFSAAGVFNKPTYDKPITLTATITSYLEDGLTKESSATLTFTLLAKGAYSTPTKADIVNYLKNVTNGTLSGTSTISGGEIDCDLNLIRKISNEQVDSASDSVYEVRLEWVINNNGVYEPISQIKRGTSAKTIDLVATITFNGEPLEDDGKVYFDDVLLTAVTEDEIRRYIIGEIASKVKNSFSNGDVLWADDDTYGCEIKWISKDVGTVTIEQNTVTVNQQAINGATCPITVQVTYPTDSGSNSFELEYVITVVTDNTALSPGANISESLYYALMLEMRDRFGYTQLTTASLKNTKFVSLDLSKYNDWFEDGAGDLHAPITDLTGLTYCENLRLLNISGLNIEKGASEIAGLTYLESFIANNVGISDKAVVGGTPLLSNMINLKLVDLSNNDLTSLDMFFSSDDIYSKLKELYLDNNNLSDISLLSQTPMLTLLTLSNNNIDSDDIAVLADKVYLTYLSLNNNNISSISSLNKLTALTELRLHCNNISDITALKNMTSMKKLYLSENKIVNIDSLINLVSMEVLYLNNNVNLGDLVALSNMVSMQVLNISNCFVDQLIALQNMTSLKELYAENNEITGFNTLSAFTAMEKLLLAGNARSGQKLEWNDYIGNMANLKVLTLSGLDVNDLSFLETTTTDSSTQATTTTIKPIQRLEIANCGITSTYTISDQSTINNMELIKKLDKTLKYLDISNNSIDSDIAKLGYLNSLELLYADNVNIGDDIVGLMASFTSIKYLSLENCNISNMYNISGKPWLSTSRKYVFVDLAQNPISGFNFSFVSNSISTLKNLYLDTTSTNAVLSNSVDYSDNVLESVSLQGYYIDNVDLLPDMGQIKALNLKNTKLADFLGSIDANGDYPYSLERYETLEYLDVSQETLDIFTKANLEMLKSAYSDITVCLYFEDQLPDGYSNVNGFDAQREAQRIIDVREENKADGDKFQSYYSNVVEFRDKQNGYELDPTLNGYNAVWSMDTQNEYFAIEDNKLYVKNIAIPGEGGAEDNYTFDLNIAMTLYGESVSISTPATFFKDKYTITYVPNDEEFANRQNVAVSFNNSTTEYTPGDEIVINNPTRGTYDIFQGWYEDADCTIEFNNDLKDNPRSVTLYAKWDLAIYYTSFEYTAIIGADKGRTRAVVDWSAYSAGTHNYLAAIDANGDGVCDYTGSNTNIDITNGITEIYFIGNPQATYANVYIYLVEFATNQNVTVHFKDFNITGALNSWMPSGNKPNVYLDCIGDNSIKANSGHSGIGDVNNVAGIDKGFPNLQITGDGNLTVTGGEGTAGDKGSDVSVTSGAASAGHGTNGTDGYSAVSSTQLTLNCNGSVTLIGGNGGKGGDGGDVLGEANLKDQPKLPAGGNGGNGGNGGEPIAISNLTITKCGALKLQHGNGGVGGKGGQGGNAYETTDVQPDNGGNGGNGGVGGSGYEAGTGGAGGQGGHSFGAYGNLWIQYKGTSGDGGDGGKGGDKISAVIYTPSSITEVQGTGGAAGAFGEKGTTDTGGGVIGNSGANGNPGQPGSVDKGYYNTFHNKFASTIK